MTVAVVVALFLVVSSAYATTTISTNVATDGNLTVSGTASTTLFSAYGPAYFGSTATSSFDTAGVLTLASALTTGNGGMGTTTWQTNSIPYFNGTRMVELNSALSFNGTKLSATYASSTAVSVSGASYLAGGVTVTGNVVASGVASSTTLLVGTETNTTVNGIVFGTCVIPDISVAVASTTAYSTCTGATGLTNSYKVFTQATSSMPAQIVIQAASSTGTGAISVRLLNTGIVGGTPAAASLSINFWAVR